VIARTRIAEHRDDLFLVSRRRCCRAQLLAARARSPHGRALAEGLKNRTSYRTVYLPALAWVRTRVRDRWPSVRRICCDAVGKWGKIGFLGAVKQFRVVDDCSGDELGSMWPGDRAKIAWQYQGGSIILRGTARIEHAVDPWWAREPWGGRLVGAYAIRSTTDFYPRRVGQGPVGCFDEAAGPRRIPPPKIALVFLTRPTEWRSVFCKSRKRGPSTGPSTPADQRRGAGRSRSAGKESDIAPLARGGFLRVAGRRCRQRLPDVFVGALFFITNGCLLHRQRAYRRYLFSVLSARRWLQLSFMGVPLIRKSESILSGQTDLRRPSPSPRRRDQRTICLRLNENPGRAAARAAAYGSSFKKAYRG